MRDLISVIVPVYKTELYIEHCVQSIRDQSYKELEIILVDDGSPDKSGELCDKLAAEDERIMVIHKRNGGLSDARNAGLEIAKGTYVLFCDSDDWMESNIILSAVSAITKTDAQMIIWGYSADFVGADGQVTQSSLSKVNAVLEAGRTNDFSDRQIQGLLGYAWNKLYTRAVVEDIKARFEIGVSLVEDVLFNARILTQCNKVVFLDEIGTHYMQRNLTTLGNAFYPDYASLILRAVVAKRTILEHFDCSQEMTQTIIADYALMAIKFGVLGVKKDVTISKKEMTERLKTISTSKSMKELLQIAKPKTIKEIILIAGLRLKAFNLITSAIMSRGR